MRHSNSGECSLPTLQHIIFHIINVDIPSHWSVIAAVSTQQLCHSTSQCHSGVNAGLQENIVLMDTIASMHDPDNTYMSALVHRNQEDGDKNKDGLYMPPHFCAHQRHRGSVNSQEAQQHIALI